MVAKKTLGMIKRIFSKSLDLIPKMSVADWADTYRMLPSTSAEPGKWRTDRAPYQRRILDAFTEKGVRKVVVKSSSQIGKSDIMNCVIGRFAHLDPCSIMLMQPTLSDAEDYSKSRITPMIENTPVLKKIFKESKSRSTGNTILSKYFIGGRLVITGANSPSSLASKPIRILLCDEVDRFPDSAGVEGDPIDLASKRTTTYWNKLIGEFSTPTIKDESRIDDEYMTGTQEEWQHCCPNCGEWHLLTHRQMKAEASVSQNKKKEKHVIVHSVVWICPDCGFSFTEAQMKKAKQKYVPQNPDAFNTDTRSFFVNCWASPWISWNEVMAEWLKAEGDPEREKVVYNTRFGESYERKGAFENESQFLQRREMYNAELPDGVLALTAAVDVQDNRLEYEVCGWGFGDESWGIHRGFLYGVPDTQEVWNMLDQVLDRTYRFADGKGLTILRTFIDTGGHYQDEVYKYCLKNYRKQRFAIKGSSQYGVPLIHKISKVKKYKNIPLIIVGTDNGKQYIMDRLSIENPGEKYMHFPLDNSSESGLDIMFQQRGYDKIYFIGLISERLEPVKQNGRIVMRWKKINNKIRNEPLDLKVYNLACRSSIPLDYEKLKNNLEGKVTVENKKAAVKVKQNKRYGAVGNREVI